MNSKTMIVAGVVAVLVIAVGAGAFIMMKPGDNSPSAGDAANKFEYSGDFGAFTLDEKSNKDTAKVSKKNDSEMLAVSAIEWKTTGNAAENYKASVEKIDAKGTFAGTSPTVLTLDNKQFHVVKYDMKMSTKNFTLVYFAAYNDEMSVECYTNPIYHPDELATDADISAVMNAVAKTLGMEKANVTAAYNCANSFTYAGNSGTFAVDKLKDNGIASVSKTNNSERLAKSTISWKAADKSEYDKAVTNLNGKGDLMSAAPIKMNVSGADFTVVKYDVTMGMNVFTLVYFAGYADGMFVDGFTDSIYWEGLHASTDDVNVLINAVGATLGCGPITVTA